MNNDILNMSRQKLATKIWNITFTYYVSIVDSFLNGENRKIN